MSECLTENEIVDFVTRNLAPSAAAEAEAHIDQCAGCQAVLIELARVFELQASSLQPEEASAEHTPDLDGRSLGLLPTQLLRGSSVGRYLTLEVLGHGAMGVVFSAYDPELDRRVALKLLRDRSGDADRNARMMREARAIARVAHPNVVVIHDVGEFDGNVFMAMELVTGGTLGHWLREREPTRDEVLRVFIEAGEGLAAAHAAGLVHRDFKPTNVLMGEDGRPRVTDFGLAKAGALPDAVALTEVAALSSSTDVAMTKTGALVGTPAFMSPEQFEGEPAGPASDQFSYCVALAEALCGRRPFEGSSLLELQTNVCAGNLRPHVLEAVPGPLQDALARGLSRDPAARYPDMRALLDVLVRYRSGPSSKLGVRVAVAATVLLGGASVAWAASGRFEAPTVLEACDEGAPRVADHWTDPRSTQLRRTIASIDRPAAARVADSVVASLDTYAERWTQAHGGVCEASGDLGARYASLRCLDRGREELAALLEALRESDPAVLEHAEEAVRGLVQPGACADPGWVDTAALAEPPEAVRAEVETQQTALQLARAFTATGQYGRASERAQQVAAAAEPIGHTPLLLDALQVEADALALEGDIEGGRVALRRAWSLALRTNDPVAQLELAAAHLDLVENAGGSEDDAALWVDSAAALYARVGPEHPAGWDYWNALGKHHGYRGDAEAAAQAYTQALQVPGIRDAQRHASLNGRLAVRGQHADAQEQQALLAESDALLDDMRTTLGPAHPRLAWALEVRSGVLARLGRGAEALEVIDQAVAVIDPVIAPDDPRRIGLLATRASARAAAGDTQGARDDAARILALRRANEAEDAELAIALNNLAVAELNLGNYEASTRQLLQALPHMKAAFGPEHLHVAACHTTLSSNLVKLERFEQAIPHLKAAGAIAAREGDASARLDPILAMNWARVHLSQRELAAAGRKADEALQAAARGYGAEHPVVAKLAITAAEIALERQLWDDAAAFSARGLTTANDETTRQRLEGLRDRAAARGR